MSFNNTEAPVEIENNSFDKEGSKTTHPAYAQIHASRVSGGQVLYGSDFTHNNYMTISIHKSELHRSLARDWHFTREEYIEVSLSEAQWATFISSPNIGSGVPCTLNHKDGKIIPSIPFREQKKEFLDEGKKTMKEAAKILVDLEKEVRDEIDKLPKKTKESILNKLFEARRRLDDRLPFIQKQFDEHVEETVEKAKVEIHGYMTGVISRAGINALSSQSASDMPLYIEDQTKDD